MFCSYKSFLVSQLSSLNLYFDIIAETSTDETGRPRGNDGLPSHVGHSGVRENLFEATDDGRCGFSF